MTLSSRDRRAIKLGAVAVAALGVYFLAVEPLARRYSNLVRSHHDAAAAIARNIRESRRLSALEEQVKTWEEKAGPLIPERTYGEQITAVGSRIIAAAGESQIQLQGATPTTSTPWTDRPTGPATVGPNINEPRLEQASINIDAQGGWENTFKFIAALYRIDGILSVEQLELTGDPKQGDKIKIRLTVLVLMKASAEGKQL